MLKETGRPGSGTRDPGKGGPGQKPRDGESQAEASRRVTRMKRGVARENGQEPASS